MNDQKPSHKLVPFEPKEKEQLEKEMTDVYNKYSAYPKTVATIAEDGTVQAELHLYKVVPIEESKEDEKPNTKAKKSS